MGTSFVDTKISLPRTSLSQVLKGVKMNDLNHSLSRVAQLTCYIDKLISDSYYNQDLEMLVIFCPAGTIGQRVRLLLLEISRFRVRASGRALHFLPIFQHSYGSLGSKRRLPISFSATHMHYHPGLWNKRFDACSSTTDTWL
jgi:hypothetical protein